ncbi:syntaxin-18-like [Daktulosphaira vitifoliae]|uniref:syntaxin-18-like n=1 Tax=Daktulosphaira vitifoliae TaxID=58002 RepID=UPI0021AA0B4A|nr:syntaxin-18-like [Daktulosphaira vitifoliae]XP_050547382.1 syntaxin-18-like [Daktulosphaira vitifoliae]
MDKTAVFKAYVKTIKTRNRAFGSPVPQTDILKQRKPRRDDFSRRAKDIVNDLAKLKDFLDRHFREYINVSSFDQQTLLTDPDRDKIDVGAQHIIKTCRQQINALEKDLDDSYSQINDHRIQIVRYVEWRLKSVSKLFADMKTSRAQRCLEYDNVLKLSNLANGSERLKETKNSLAVENDAVDRLHYANHIEEELSPEELQMFEAENIEMYNELNQLSNEVRNIESKAVRIAELQELFMEKIIEQELDLERIDAVAVNTTENIVDANTEIRSAIQTNAGLRVYVLFFILVLSFTLLFLDWYND